MSRLRVGLCASLTPDIMRKLQQAKINTVTQFVTTELETICQLSSVPYKELAVIRRLLLAQFSSFPVNGADLYKATTSTVAILSTGCASLDQLLDGGLYTSELTEVTGSPGSGKTQVCTNIALSVSMETEQNVLWLDTGASFDPDRIQDILAGKQLDDQTSVNVCARVKCCHAFDVFELLDLLHSIQTKVAQQMEPFYSGLKLIVLDCLTSVISPHLGGVHSEGLGYLMSVARCLTCLAVENSIAVLVTNNVVGDQHGGTKPALGRAWSHVPHTRLEMRHTAHTRVHTDGQVEMENTSARRVAELTKSSRQVIGKQTALEITDSGIVSPN